MNWYLAVLKKYAVFSGRARRKEFWMFQLINYLILIVILGIDRIAPESYQSVDFGLLYMLAVLLPWIAVGVRRLHDTGRSSSWLAISLVPVVGVLVLLKFCVEDSQPGENLYGPNPKLAAAP